MLAGGGSEAAAPVAFAARSGSRASGRVGPAGAAGLPGAAGMSLGLKIYARPSTLGGSLPPLTFGATWSGSGLLATPVTLATTNDLEGRPRAQLKTANVALANQSTFTSTDATRPVFQMGNGAGRGGFYMVWQFGLDLFPAGGRWFVGVAPGQARSGDPSAWGATVPGIDMIGVGQDAGDSTAHFLHQGLSVTANTATKVSTGIAMVANRLYEVVINADPRTTTGVISLESFVGGVSTAKATYTAATNLPLQARSAYMSVNHSVAGGGLMGMAFLSFYAEIQPRAA